MRAFQIPAPGEPPALTRIRLPAPARGEIRLRIKACGLNFADLLMQQGTYQDTPAPPFTLGMEVAGDVLELGENVDNLSPGDRIVVFSGQGGLAEEGIFDAARALPLPATLSYEQGAACQIAYGTGHVALAHCARLAPGETLLVTGAAGGVGLTAVEIGKLLGARVIAHARGAEKLEVARRAGADDLIEDGEDLRVRLRALGGADVVYDAVGGPVWQAAFRAANPGARLLPIGFASGAVPQIPANHLLVKNLTVIGFYLGGYMKLRPAVVRDSLRQIIDWIAAGRLSPPISHVLPLERAGEGLELLRSRRSTGKVVITP
jgi:NADPH2:quinone reductase